MMEKLGDPRFMIEIGPYRFDPKAEASRARQRVKAAKKHLANALRIDVADLPGAEREAWIVQFADDLEAETVSRFSRDYGRSLTHAVSALAFIERMTREMAAKVRRDFVVRACIPYWPELKLAWGGSTLEDNPSSLTIGLIDGDDVMGVASALEALGWEIALLSDDRSYGGELTMMIDAAESVNVRAIAAMDDVAWVITPGDLRVKNFDTAGIAQGGAANSHPIWDKGIHGEGMIVGVIDRGELDLLSKFLRDSAHPAPSPEHRKVVQERRVNSTAPPPPVPAHPTWVSGCVCADEEGANSGKNQNRGGAWAARIAYGDARRFIGPSRSSGLFSEFYEAALAGARVHTGGWGVGSGSSARPYDRYAQDIDAFLWQTEDHVCVTGAPNPNTNFDGGLTVAKNPVVVGGVASPNQDSRLADPGPLTTDRRRKPDLLAVAEDVTTSNTTGSGSDPPTATVSGNSFAAPHVAAVAALVRQYFTEGWYPSGRKQTEDRHTPSGALLKAALLNATVPLARGRIPSRRDGWGRLQIDKTLHFDGDKLRLLVKDIPHAKGLNWDGPTGNTRRYSFRVPDNVKWIRITLVFNDPKGVPNDVVVNKLDLEVMEPNRRFGYFANDFLGDSSRRRDFQASGLKVPPNADDLKNNVRQVAIEPLFVPSESRSGRWTIVVRAHKVDQANTPSTGGPRRSQGYALVACVELN
jgi:Subtilase family